MRPGQLGSTQHPFPSLLSRTCRPHSAQQLARAGRAVLALALAAALSLPLFPLAAPAAAAGRCRWPKGFL